MILPKLDRTEQIDAIGAYVTKLTAQKNAAYGDSVTVSADIMKVLYPDGVSPEQYQDMLVMVRLIDKMNRIAGGDKTAFGENPWLDVAGYGIIAAACDTKQLADKVPWYDEDIPYDVYQERDDPGTEYR